MRSLLGRVILVGGFSYNLLFSYNLQHFKYILPLPLVSRVSAEKSAINLIAIPFYVICSFSLAAFNIFSLYLTFDSLVNMCLGVFLLGFILYGTLCTSWPWVVISVPMLGKFLTIISSNIFSGPFSLSSPSGTLIMERCYV